LKGVTGIRRRDHQSGFSVFVAVAVVAAIGVVGVAGWLVYLNHHSHYKLADMVSTANTSVKSQASTSEQNTTPATSNTSTNSQTSTNKGTTSSTTTYFTIKEWGIRAPYSGSLTLKYTVRSSGIVSLSSSQLAAGGPDVCTADGNSDAGNLGRYLPTDANLAPKIPANETAEQYIEQNATVPHAKIGDYIYIYWGSNYLANGAYNGPCNDKAAGLQTISAYSDLVPKLEAIQ